MSIRGHQNFSKIDPLNGYATDKLNLTLPSRTPIRKPKLLMLPNVGVIFFVQGIEPH
jgi:hypothetical protein